MHIPDNYLSPSTCTVIGAVMIPIWTKTVNKVNKIVTRKKMPLMGIGAAFSFLIMMFNIPLPGGTTGHAVGGTLVALLLGPEAACLSLTVALLIQALLFGDGGILAFGVNSFNMAFIMPFVGYNIYKFFRNKITTDKGETILIFIASYTAINISALFAAIEFGIQPLLFKTSNNIPIYCPYSLNISIPAMVIPHLLVAGIVEGMVTVGVYKFVKGVSPSIIYKDSEPKLKPLYKLIIMLIILSPLGLLASGTAFGEWNKEELKNVVTNGKTLNYIPQGMENGFNLKTLMPDYSILGLPEILGYILSAIVGVSLLIISFKIFSSKKFKTK